jgi:hypothetical protein
LKGFLTTSEGETVAIPNITGKLKNGYGLSRNGYRAVKKAATADKKRSSNWESNTKRLQTRERFSL